jgi:F-type H+-transporting ATPase subunit delta
MTPRGSATRYARALLDVAIAESIADRAEQDLAGFAALLESHADLRRALTHPAIPVARKKALVEQLTARLATTKPVAKLLSLIADRDRLALVPDLLSVYRERLQDYQQIVRAELTTAESLTPDAEARLRQRLATATGRTVTLTTRVDPSIIGGVVARIGSVVYDGSIATQLSRMRERLERQL